jgi:hypothetical protein
MGRILISQTFFNMLDLLEMLMSRIRAGYD